MLQKYIQERTPEVFNSLETTDLKSKTKIAPQDPQTTKELETTLKGGIEEITADVQKCISALKEAIGAPGQDGKEGEDYIKLKGEYDRLSAEHSKLSEEHQALVNLVNGMFKGIKTLRLHVTLISDVAPNDEFERIQTPLEKFTHIQKVLKLLTNIKEYEIFKSYINELFDHVAGLRNEDNRIDRLTTKEEFKKIISSEDKLKYLKKALKLLSDIEVYDKLQKDIGELFNTIRGLRSIKEIGDLANDEEFSEITTSRGMIAHSKEVLIALKLKNRSF